MGLCKLLSHVRGAFECHMLYIHIITCYLKSQDFGENWSDCNYNRGTEIRRVRGVPGLWCRPRMVFLQVAQLTTLIMQPLWFVLEVFIRSKLTADPSHGEIRGFTLLHSTSSHAFAALSATDFWSVANDNKVSPNTNLQFPKEIWVRW